MERIHASVVFADLTGFTALVSDTDDAAYIAFMTEFRSVVYGCIEPFEHGNQVECAFWGDEVKVIFRGGDRALNARHAIACARDVRGAWADAPTNRARRAAQLPAVTFKVGVASGEVTVGLFGGARSPESEGRPLCVARTLSKLARGGEIGRVFIDPATYALADAAHTAIELAHVSEHDAWEIVPGTMG